MSNRALVIFGGTGDLARRMLFPSLYFLHQEGRLAPDTRIFGLGRSSMAQADFADMVRIAVKARADGYFDEATFAAFAERLNYQAIDAEAHEGFDELARRLGPNTETTFYLSTSPSLYGAICARLASAGLNHANCRIVLEKPIGRDLPSSKAINDGVAAAFSEDRTLRIDHYLGKETVQNLLALRFANSLFEPLWNSNIIDHVEITIAETVGLEGRAEYYDNYGALRDMLQNHLLQLLCLVAMEPPASLDPDSVRNEKVKVLRSLRPITPHDVEKHSVRGQYRAGIADGAAVKGYADESPGFAAKAETFVALRAFIDNWRWAGVPFYLRTGKRMAERRTQIVIQFRCVPHSIFPNARMVPNKLIINIQPEENISLILMNNAPGLAQNGTKLRSLPLNLSLDDAFKDERPRRRIAYERLLLDAMAGRSTLFVRRDEVEAAWTWVDGIVAAWESRQMAPMPYNAGAWGPDDAVVLARSHNHSWHN
ncbi:MAG TPA: glucose-6-phosphate dehydrogenase [Hyphomonadaceae bacterium]|jgi:glucose-6-phosphate 1-dehydrogenase (EC 1.1.1.49)|nr:glucose-6-phosphate dehydrogenase [Hyphomonadaceae bacterium]